MGKERDYGGSEDSPDACFGGLGLLGSELHSSKSASNNRADRGLSGLRDCVGVELAVAWGGGGAFRRRRRGHALPGKSHPASLMCLLLVR